MAESNYLQDLNNEFRHAAQVFDNLEVLETEKCIRVLSALSLSIISEDEEDESQRVIYSTKILHGQVAEKEKL